MLCICTVKLFFILYKLHHWKIEYKNIIEKSRENKRRQNKNKKLNSEIRNDCFGWNLAFRFFFSFDFLVFYVLRGKKHKRLTKIQIYLCF